VLNSPTTRRWSPSEALKLQIEKLNRDRYGPRSDRTAPLLDQLISSN
jgi:hypothetical protein